MARGGHPLENRYSTLRRSRKLPLGPERNDFGRARDIGICRIFADQNDIAVANAIDPPIDFVARRSRSRGLHDLGTPDELPALHDVTFAGGIDQHRLGGLEAGHDADQLELVERILVEDHFALRFHPAADLLHEYPGVRAKRVAAPVTLR